MSSNPFTEVAAQQDFGAHECHVSWTLDDTYIDASFIVRRSPDGERNITLLKSNLDEDARYFVDPEFTIGNRTGKLYYQVIMRYEGVAYYSGFVEAAGRKVSTTIQEDPALEEELQPDDIIEQTDHFLEEEERVEPTEPIQILKPINRELGIIKHIQKWETINMDRSGVNCAILKPKTQGTLSHEGLDQDTDQELNTRGSNRYGQKYEGGYEEPIYTKLLGLQARPDKVIPAQGGEGETDKYIYKVRMIGEPNLRTNDIIVDLTNDFRYAVNSINNYQFRGAHNVLLEANLMLLPRTDIIYELSVDYTV